MDATRLIWANPIGVAIFGAATAAALAARRFDGGQPAAAQVARLAETLPADGAARLERLRGFGAGVGRALTCSCSRVMLADATAAILIAATQHAGSALPLAECVRRLLAGSGEPVAAFSANGELLAVAPAAPSPIGTARSLATLGLTAMAEEALRTGHAQAQTAGGPIALDRLDSATTPILIATLAPAQAAPGSIASEVAAPAIEAASVDPQTATPVPPQAAVSTPPISAPAMAAPTPSPAPERRHPLRFVWQMDAEGRFTIGSDEFLELIGPRSAALLGGRWDDIAAALGLDPDGHVARAINSRDTWSGLSIGWPVDDSHERLEVELSGLPVFDRDRNFRGYRGFGVCRDLARLAALAQARQPQTCHSLPTPVTAPDAGVISSADATAEADKTPASPTLPSPNEMTAIENIVPFPAGTTADVTPALTAVEHRAFGELTRRLTARLNKQNDEAAAMDREPSDGTTLGDLPRSDPTLAEASAAASAHVPDRANAANAEHELFRPEPGEEAYIATPRGTRSILDRLPLGVLVYRLEHLLYANHAFLDWAGHDDLASLAEAGGLISLLIRPTGDGADGPTFTVANEHGDRPAVEGLLTSVQWDGDEAHALVITIPPGATEVAPVLAMTTSQTEIRDLKSILDTTTDGVLVLDREGHISSANRSAEALFGQDESAFAGRPFTELLAPESERAARDYVAGLLHDGVANVLYGGLEVIGRERRGGLIPLFMTVGRLGEDADRLCVVLRDMTQWKKAEEELSDARRKAEQASTAKSDFLAKVSHEIRTPLNSIIGFSEVMMQERFGPIGNERYREYLKDIRASGTHLISLVNDLFDLSKIEAGKLELTFAGLSLNELVQQCIATLQPQANRERVIIRTSLSPKLPQVTADARSLRQIVLNLLANSIKFSGAGGQVIVSTTVIDTGDVSLHVRDNGVGMTETEIVTALEPFRQLATSTRFGSGGTGLGLPLTKAMAQANRASFHISSKPDAGTLVQVTFPKTAAVAAE